MDTKPAISILKRNKPVVDIFLFNFRSSEKGSLLRLKKKKTISDGSNEHK